LWVGRKTDFDGGKSVDDCRADIGSISDPLALRHALIWITFGPFRAGRSSVSDGQHEQIQADYQSLVRFG
jgi:hypothetical protein